ncbi:MAG: DUF4105 domain-containing protein [Saprospiraceae bacterium]|nr:DUF4105 domain-containing protein [Saprospiraceae bacterium]
MTRSLLFFLLLLTACPLASQPGIVLSENARISLMTVAPGDMLYSTFGHSALRVRDPEHRIDRCYNYGTFDFEQPNFILKFCQGRLLYFLDIEPARSFEYGNLQDRRPMQEQLLQLDSADRQRLFGLLEENALEQNRYYKYDFFYDNCATRIRDIVQECFFHQLNFDTTALPPNQTMRGLLRPYLKQLPWTQFGIDLALGLPADRMALAEDYMFLPDYVHDLFGRASLPNGRPLVLEERQIPSQPLPERPALEPGLFGNPFLVLCIVALIGLLSMANARTERIFDTLFWLTLGLAGLVLLLLWVATDHGSTKSNWNLLWALPTHLLFFWRRRHTELTENYFMVTGAIAVLLLLFWGFLPQDLPEAALPIVVLIAIKSFFRRFWKRDTLEGREPA